MKLIKISKEYYDTKIKELPFNRKYTVRQDLMDKMNVFGYTVPAILIETDIINGKKELYVADGQHRLATAHYLNIEATAVVVKIEAKTKSDLVKFVSSLNSVQKAWTLQNYVDSYAYLGLEDYVNLNKITAKVPYSVNTIVVLLAGIRGKSVNTSKVKDGEFKINHEQNTANTLDLASKLSKHEKVTSRMLIALHYVCNMRDFDEELFTNKFIKNVKKIKELKLDDYSDIFVSWCK